MLLIKKEEEIEMVHDNYVHKTETLEYNFFLKKEKVSFILSVFVVCIHASSFGQYNLEGLTIVQTMLIEFFNVFLRKSFVLIAVPLFFILSGATFFRDYTNETFLNKIKRRIHTLIIPYLIWNIFAMLFDIITSYSFISNYFKGREKFEITLGNILNAIFHYGCNGPFWFIFALICFMFISPVIYLLIRNKYIGLGTIAVLIILDHFNIVIPGWLILDSKSIIFYFLGCWIGKNAISGFEQRTTEKKSAWACLVFVVCVCSLIGIYYIDIWAEYTLQIFILIAGALAFWVGYDKFDRWIPYCSYFSYSFLIFAMHKNILSVIIKCIYIVFPKKAYMIPLNFFISVLATIYVIALFATIVRKISPKTYSILSGGRAGSSQNARGTE